MASNYEESEKREELLKIVHECFVNKYNVMGDLLEYRGMNDTEWVDREVMCYVLREDVFHLVYWGDIEDYFMLCDYRVNRILPKVHTITLKFADYEEALERLIDSMESQFKTELCEWNRHWKLCYALFWMLDQDKHSLSDQTCERMFDYLVKLLETCDDEETIEKAWSALSQISYDKFDFQLAKYQASLIKLIINSLESFPVESRNYSKNLNLICGALKYCENLLDKSKLKEIYNYLLRLTESYQEDDEMITQVFDTLSVFPFTKCCSFQFDKFETSLLKLIDFAENENAKTKWKKHEKLCRFLEWTLRDFKDSLGQPTLERMLDYLVKLFETCDDEYTIMSALRVSKHFPFDKHQSLPFQLLDSIRNNLQNKEEQSQLKIHNNLCKLMKDVLFKCKASLSYQTGDRLLNDFVKLIETCEDEKMTESYWIVLRELPFDKYQTLLIQLIDLVKNKQNDGQLSNIRMCGVMKRLLWPHEDSLNPETHSRMCDYLMKLTETCDDEKTIESACDALQSFSLPKIQSFLIEALHSTMNNSNSFTRHNWKMHQNFCRILDRLQINRVYPNIDNSTLFDKKIMNSLFDYFSKLFAHCNDMATILSSVLMIEKLIMKGLWDNEIMKLLKDKLLHGQQYGDYYNNGGVLPDNIDFELYQVDWCVRWCMDNVMGRDGVTELPVVKLSHDRCEARNDNRYVGIYFEINKEDKFYSPVRSSFPVSCGVYYYEVTVVTNRKMMFGWSTRETRFEDNTLIENKEHFGYDKHSIGFHASRKLIVHNSQEFTYPDLPDCVAGDVIGCLIDCDARRFVFYYKGHEMELVGGDNEDDKSEDEESEDEESEDGEVMSEYVKISATKRISFSLSPYFATATLSLHQQCHFNFGQSPFKFVPKGIPFRHFHDASGGDGSKYQLNRAFTIDEKISNLDYWFKYSPVDNNVDLFYCDKIQKKCDDEVKNRYNRYIRKWRLKNDEIQEGFECVRYIQSIIEVMDKVIGDDDKVDVVALWIGIVIEEWIDDANEAKLLELLYPYLQLRINSPQDAIKHRYICIVLSHIIKYSEYFDNDFIKHIRTEVFTYLTRTLTETNDEWSKLFVLIAIDNLKLSEEEMNETKRNAKLNYLLNIDYHQQNVLQILKSTNKFVDYQVYLCAQLCNERTFITTILDELNWQTPLNVYDRTKELKLSRDRLSARSDWEWQSVRSTSCDIDYYEALLLTSGPMRIGWATKRTNLYRTEIGDDQFSIALDGFNQCVWHNREAFPVRNISNRWRAGDIVGCRFDKKQRAFYFSLNGKSLVFDCKIYISSQAYYAATSLYTHQQCYFCLGQLEFKFNLDNSSKEAFISNSSLTNSIINVNSTSTIGDVSFSFQQSMGPMSVPKEMCQILPIFNRSLNKRGYPDQDDGATIICQLCHRQVCFKRLKTDCCEHFSMLFKFESTQPQTPSITSNLPQTFEALPNPGTPSTSKAVNITKQINQCQHCDQIIQSRPLQFVGCAHGKVCSDCVSVMLDCPKCKRMAPNVNQSSSIECQHCDQQIESRPLQFVDCVHGKMCRDCVSYILDCPKCRRLGK